MALALPTMPLVRENARSSSSNFCDDESWGFWLMRLRLSSRCRASMSSWYWRSPSSFFSRTARNAFVIAPPARPPATTSAEV